METLNGIGNNIEDSNIWLDEVMGRTFSEENIGFSDLGVTTSFEEVRETKGGRRVVLSVYFRDFL